MFAVDGWKLALLWALVAFPTTIGLGFLLNYLRKRIASRSPWGAGTRT